MHYLAGYREGEHVQVWTDLYGQGGIIRSDQVMWAEAEAVARKTMARIQRNLDRRRDELPEIGYRFYNPDQARQGPARTRYSSVGYAEPGALRGRTSRSGSGAAA